MGQKVSPTGLRVGVVKDWDSKWYANKKDLPKFLHQDIKIRDIIEADRRIKKISKVEIQRTSSKIEVNIFSAAPGLVLGENNKGIELLVKKIQKAITRKEATGLKLNVVAIDKPELEAYLIAEEIAEKLENRASFRTVQKQAMRAVMRAGAKGIKTAVSGRLGGADMARTEGYTEGIVPLSTIRQDIDYGTARANTTYGVIGVKVWISRGEILSKKNKGGNK